MVGCNLQWARMMGFFKYAYLILLTFYCLLASTASFAYAFNIAPTAGTTLPTVVITDHPVTAYYTVTNNTLSFLNNNFVKYLPPNVSQVTSGGTYANTCGAAFNLASGASCTLQLTVSGAVNASDPNPHHHLFVCLVQGLTCAGTNSPLNVMQKTLNSIAITPVTVIIRAGQTQQYTAIGTYTDGSTSNLTASVTWNSSNTTIATISASGLATADNTGGSTNITATMDGVVSNSATLTVAVLTSIAVTPTNATINLGQTQQYTAIGTYSDGSTTNLTTTANWNSSNTGVATISGTGLATSAGDGSTTITASQGSITSNNATLVIETYGYVTSNLGHQVSVCNVNSDGSFSGCHATATNLGSLVGIAINPAISFAYVASNNTSNIYYCPVNSNGSFGTCNIATNGLTPLYLSVNPAGSFVYIVSNTSVTYCPINNDGSLGSCVPTGSFTAPSGIAINPAGTFAYITSSTNKVSYCALNSDGSFGTCTSTGNGFTNPIDIAINPAGTFAYVTNTTNTVSVCPINSDGSFGVCAGTGSGFSGNLSGIAIHPLGTFAYVVSDADTAFVCPINNDGTLSACVGSGSGFNSPLGVAVT